MGSHIEKIQKILENKNRIIFGFEIGEDCELTKPAHAFVERLYTFESDIQNEKDITKKIELISKRNKFLKTCRSELREDESYKDMIMEAISFCKTQETRFEILTRLNKRLTNNEIEKTMGETYMSRLRSEVHGKYRNIASFIQDSMVHEHFYTSCEEEPVK